MSQYPSPYTPPPVNYGGYDFNYYQPGQDPLAPAKRASIMMFVMGALLALGGLCCGAVAALGPIDEVMAQNAVLNSTPGVTADMLKLGMIVLGVVTLLLGMAMLILGYFVRGGGMVPAVLSLVLVSLAALFLAAIIVTGAVQAGGGGPQMVGVCMYLVPLALLIALIAMLLQAVKAAPRVAMMKSQYQQQYWQYQQQQQMYQYAAQQQQQQQAMPGGTQPPPPMPPPVPPPPPPDSGSPGDPTSPSA